MTFGELVAALTECAVRLQRDGDDLMVLGEDDALSPSLLQHLSRHKRELLDLVDASDGDWLSPAFAITPEMLPLVTLTQVEIDEIVKRVPGGTRNVQDIYPLAPLQEGILFHHMMTVDGDPYLLHGLYRFDTRARLDVFLRAMQAVIDRHDILRTAVIWEGVPEPVQVVLRQAPLPVDEVVLDAAAGDIATQLLERFHPRHFRIDVRTAPMMRVRFARDVTRGGWVVLHLFHHLVADHTTLEVMLGEVKAHVQGRTASLPAPVPFRHLVEQARGGLAHDEHEAFFREMLSDVDEPSAPYGLTDVRGDGTGVKEAWREVELDVALRLRSHARELGVSTASLFHLAWALVLARLSGRDDVVFGTVLFGRLQGGRGADRVLGVFVNTLPIRLRIDERTVQQSVLDAHARLHRLLRHEHASLALAQRCSAVEAPAPLFSALLNYRHAAGGSQQPADDVWDGVEFLGGEERTNYPVNLNVDDLGEGFVLNAQVQVPADPEQVCAYMHSALVQLADAMTHGAATPLCELDVMPAAERERLVREWNVTAVPYPRTSGVHTLFEAWVSRTPNAVAVRDGTRELSYAELDAHASRLAHRLRASGVRAGSRVGLALARSVELVAAQLAVLKCAAAYVPLDLSAPAQRQAFMLSDSGAVAVVSARGVEVAHEGVERVDVDGPWWSAGERAQSEVTGGEAVAYVMYTSGSTGEPKGVEVPHRAIARLVVNNGYAQFEAGDRVAFTANPAFDASTMEVWAALTNGASIVVVDQDTLLDADKLAACLREQHVTVLHLVSGLLNAHAETLAPALGGLRHLLTGGDVVDPRAVAHVLRNGRPQHLIHCYGPSESTTFATTQEVVEADAAHSLPIGRPIANTQAYVLDARLRPVPQGVAGELVIGGDGLAHGYLNRPGLTAERFVPNPFAETADERLYRTGDLVRHLPDGALEFLGRIDAQVKIRGMRIEPGEIEARLAAFPAVRDSVVLVRATRGQPRLIAYYTTQDGTAVDASALRSHLAEALPDYMVPTVCIALARLPLTRNGKLDRDALPEPHDEHARGDRHVAPEGEIERTLAALWQEVLGLERVGRHDNFFEAGGHSLLAITLIERMRRVGLHADVRALFTSPTLADLAAHLASGSARFAEPIDVPANRIAPGCDAITPEMLPLVRLQADDIARIVASVPGGAANVQDIYPLAPLQEGILFHHLAAAAGDPYLLRSTLGFETRDRMDAFLHALQRVIDRHDILRTAVHWEGLPEPVQVVWRRATLEVEALEFDSAQDDVVAQLHARFNADRYRLDLRAAPLMRVCTAYDAVRGRWIALLLNHHLLGDHAAQDLLLAEIEVCLLGRAESLPPPVPFRNFVAQARLGVSREEHEAFFRSMLGDVQAQTTPFGLRDVQGSGEESAGAWLEIDSDLTRRLRASARNLGASLAGLCHVAWAQVLSRVSGCEDVVFGTVLFGRAHGGDSADRVPGLFMNTLPMRMNVADASVRDSVAHAHALLAQLLRHEHAPLALAQRCSQVPAPEPLFSALFNYRHGTASDGRQARAQGAWQGIELLEIADRTNYPFTLSIDDAGERLMLHASVCAPAQPERICAYMQVALQGLAHALEQAPDTPLRVLDVMPRDESRMLLDVWSTGGVSEPGDAADGGVHAWFEAWAAKMPDAVALEHEGARMTYGALNAQANRLARHLRELGVGPDRTVALWFSRSPDMIVALLAVLKAGGAYVPLDPRSPRRRIADIVADCSPVAVLTHGAVPYAIGSLLDGQEDGVPIIDLHADAARWAAAADTDLPPLAGRHVADDLAYVIYTSGSTGAPKGVMVEHRNVRRQIAALRSIWRIDARDRLLQFASINFDVSVEEIFCALMSGATLVLRTDEWMADATTFWALCEAHEISFANLPTRFWEQIARDKGDGEVPIPRCVRIVVFGGEAVGESALAAWHGREGYRPSLWNAYGPTETTINALLHEPVRDDENPRIVGRPVSATRAYLLDPRGRPVPVGVIGELYLGGDCVARGYLNQPARTAERFIPDPFALEPGARMYRTGDLARHLPDGRLEYLGRNDFQIKIRGYRVEPGEIEAQMLAYPGVREAAVVARKDRARTGEDVRLFAYYTWAGSSTDDACAAYDAGGPVDDQALMDHLRATLPDYMVPAACVALDALPLTTGGKLDRDALPEPDWTPATPGREAPVGDVEPALAAIWAEVLQIDVGLIGRHDHFFALGGHSLLAVRVISQLRRTFGIEAAVADLFAHPTLTAQAASIRGAARSTLPPVSLAPRDRVLPLSFAQQRLWLLAQMEGLSQAYHIPMGLRLAGNLDTPTLRRALDRVVARHEALRTTFVVIDGEPAQRIAPPDIGFVLCEHDLRTHEDGEAAAATLAAQEALAPFDLTAGPLVRGQLLRLRDDLHVLLVTMHHIAADGWSTRIFIRETAELYRAFSAGLADPLPPLAIQYADYAAWQRCWVADDSLQSQATYWQHALAGAPMLLSLPTDRARPVRPDHRGAAAPLELDATLTADLRALSRKHGVTLFMTLLAAWAVLIGRLAGQDDVIVGSPAANRGRAEVEPLIGLFLNTLALRVDLSGSPSVADLLARVKAATLEGQTHQDLPFEQVVEIAKPPRSLAHHPLFQVLINWQAGEADEIALPGLACEPYGAPYDLTKFDLALNLAEAGDVIVGGLTYATALFDEHTMTRYAGYLRNLLRGMAADDEAAIDRLRLMDDIERHHVLHDWNASSPEPAGTQRDGFVHESFEAQAAKTPDAIALAHGNDRLTYRELNARANRLAAYLRERGVAPDVRVALCVERGSALVTAILAILKAGGAYVPLDPTLPPARLATMLDDSVPLAVLTHARASERIEAAARVLTCAVPIIDIDAHAHLWAHQPEGDLDAKHAGLAPHHLAYIIYTSGSTGTPKAAQVEHRGLSNLLAWYVDDLGLTADDAVLLVTAHGFDLTQKNIFGPLSVGGTLHLADEPFDARAIVALVARERITQLNLAPSAFHALIDANDGGELRCLRRVVLGGEPVQPARLMALPVPRPEFVNSYGPTECSDVVAWHRLSPDLDVYLSNGGGVPIGRPIRNMRLYVLDAHGEPVPPGVVGEIHVAGIGVGRGYLHRPELDDARFGEDVFQRQPGARIYRTGDLGRYLPDGAVEFLGRNDFQVKIRGLRVELGEIETRLAEHPSVREAVVVARDEHAGELGNIGERRLVAYCVAAGEALDIDALRAHLAAALPEHMVPAAFVAMAALPLNASGKLDRRALPAPDAAAFGPRAGDAPAGDVEVAVARIWAALLQIDDVQRQDDFFDLGGHSLLAERVVSRLRRDLDAEVTLADLFAHPVLADFAQTVQRARRSSLPDIDIAARDRPLALSFAQQRLWFLAQSEQASRAYHVPTGVRLHGALDRSALRRALDGLVARHEALRTTFVLVDGTPVQRVGPANAGFALRERDLRAEHDVQAVLERLVSEEAAAPFDLETGPLIRGCLLTIADDDHALVIAAHHIVTDGWSQGVLMRELDALYRAFSRGEADPLPPLAIQYADYAAWQRAWVSGDVLAGQHRYWARDLADAPILLNLPTDRPRPAKQDHVGERAGFVLEPELSAALKELGQACGATLFMTLLAAWGVVLSRFAGQEEVVIGSPVANRARTELEPLVGPLMNTLALRVDLRGEPSVSELLERVKTRVLAAQAHQDLPFEQVVEIVNPPRSAAHSPIFQVSLTWHNQDAGALDLPGLVPTPLQAPLSSAQFDLSLFLAEEQGEAGPCIGGSIVYATALFDAGTIARHLSSLRAVLQGMVADAGQPVDRLPLIDATERERLLKRGSETVRPYPRMSGVHTLFEAWVSRTPNAVAVRDGTRELSYAELDAHASRLAHRLRASGVRAGSRVGLALARSVELVAAQLAVLKCAAAYVPLDLSAPAQRQAFMLSDSGAVAVVSARGVEVAHEGVERVDVDGPWWSAGERAQSEVTGGEAVAYVMYTSGSTGEPKGVEVPHRAIARLVVNNGYAQFEAGDRVAFTANPAFDASTMEVWAALTNGASIVVVDQDTLLDASRCVRHLLRQDVSVMWLTVGLFNQYAEALAPVFERLRYLIVGGDALDPAVVARVLRDSPPQHLLNGYGPTEATTFALTHEVRAVPDGALRIPIGRPIANTEVYLLDRHGEPVPVGVAGELYIGGDGLAHGYLGRAALTAERFIDHPFSDVPGAKLFRTGDLARYLDDGSVDYLGRLDTQVKLRGLRIELGEIEVRLAEHPAVREVAVLVREDSPGDKQLVAYYVAVPGGGTIDPAAMRVHLSAVLPEYMVPAAYVALDALPLTANGKLDRRALPRPVDEAYATRAYAAPEGEIEAALARLWMELLKVERVGRHDHFFDLGGHSLLAIKLVSRLRKTMGVELSVTELFDNPVLDGLARVVERTSDSVLPPIAATSRDVPLPLSFAQQRLWFLAQMPGVSAAYHIPLGLQLRGALDRDALRRALECVVARHEALRTVFSTVDGEPVQRIVSPDRGFALRLHDLSGRADATNELRRLVTEEAAMPFDLEAGPLIRGRLIALDSALHEGQGGGANELHVLLVTLHHIVADGWSMGVLMKELSTLYRAFCEGRADPLPALDIHYADYAVWQRKWIAGDVLQAQLAHWVRTLAGAPVALELPTDRPRLARRDYGAAELTFVLDAELTAGLKALARRHGGTLFTTVLAAWAAVLGRLSGQDDIVIGTVVANRQRPELETLVGFFVNTLALRIDLSGMPTVAQLLRRTRASTLAAQEHQDLPFEQVVEAVSPPRSTVHTPLFQVMFSWQNNETGELDLPGLDVAPVDAQYQAAKFDLTLNCAEVGDHIVGSLAYATALFDADTVERYGSYLCRALRAMVEDEDHVVERLPLLAEAERHRLLVEWNMSGACMPRERCIHHDIQRQAQATPDAIAVEQGGIALSYGELDRQANRLAHRLRALGAGPDACVAVCADRSPAMLTALLAVLKAGAAYVPIDPAYPAARIAWLLDDCAPVAVLTDTAAKARLGEAAPAHARHLFDMQADSARWLSEPDHDPEVGVQPASLAYVIYTSGSTGQPKGVMVEHRQLANLVDWHCAAFDIRCGSRTTSMAGVGFDAAAWEAWPALCTGATLLLPPAGGLDAALAWWQAQSMDVSFLPTPTAEHVITGKLAPRRLRTLLTGGDRLGQYPAASQPFDLVNNYGPTETTVVATSGRIDPADSVLHIGRPIANARVYVLDRHGEPVPRGAIGEIHIGGAGVARGYLNQPDLTAERFLADPFDGAPGARMFRTGDLARHLADGRLVYVGRNDAQLKLRGFRIEPGEIEARLVAHPAVREAVVIARDDEGRDGSLVAYYTVRRDAPGRLPGAHALRVYLEAVLPDYMVPAAYVELDALPFTPNGKVDRAALPAPADTDRAARAYEVPIDATEATLATLWAELLGQERVGRHDHFFELGGHSLLATRLISRVRAALGVELDVTVLFERPVLSALADAVRGAGRNVSAPVSAALGAPAGGGHEPADASHVLSFAQQRLWFLAQMDGVSEAYHLPLGLRLVGALDGAALKRALDRIVARHAALRTTFMLVDEQPVQRVASAASGFTLLEDDFSRGADAEEALERLISREAMTPFDLGAGPLFRGRLVRMGARDHALLLTLHHIVADGWSMNVLMRELAALYRAYSAGEADPLPPLSIQYADYARWQRSRVSDAVLQSQADYWRTTLSAAPPLLALPTDRARPPRQDHAGASISFSVDAGLAAGLKALAHRQGTTPYMTVLAAWAIVLSRFSGQDSVVVGTGVANRGRAELEPLIGLFVNTLPLCLDVSGRPTVAQLMQRVKVCTLQAQAHQDLPFEQIVELANPQRSLAHHPVFQVMFAWQDGDAGTEALPALPGIAVSITGAPQTMAKFDLTLSMGMAGDELIGSLEYATALFDRATVERHCRALLNTLRAMVEDDSRNVDGVALLDEAERHLLLDTWNIVAADASRGACLHVLFEAQAARHADAIAVEYEGTELTYGALNVQANRLAHYLRKLGVRPDTRVAVCVERGCAMIVAVLAILKAGGAYVPIDPAYPPERLSAILSDSAPVALLTDRAALPAEKGEAGVAVLDLEADAARWAGEDERNPEDGSLSPAHLAYVIYTSGTTGQPKGVMVEHRNVSRLFSATQPWFGFTRDDVWTLFHSVAFDFSVWEIWGALLHGGKLVIVPHLVARAPEAFYQLLCERRVTMLSQTPGAFRQLLPAQAASTLRHRLRHVILGGEALDTAALMPWYQREDNRGAQLSNMYGITETTVHVTWHPLTRADAERSGAGPIGRRIPDLRLYLLDAAGQPVPVGVTGEIYVGGAGVARGYLNQPQLTAQRFLRDPFAPSPDARMYRSGDLGRYLPDGSLEYLGRNDAQIKLRGFRIELSEIEARLGAHPAVQDVRVVMRELDAQDRRLAAYIVPSQVHASVLARLLRMERAGLGTAARRMTLPNGLTVFHQNASETEFVFDEIFRDEVYLRHGITLEDGDCVFDVGANIGLFTLFVGLRCPNARIYAFEPIPPVFHSLESNVQLYGLDVALFECGLSDEARHETFAFYPHNTVISSSRTSTEAAREAMTALLRNRPAMQVDSLANPASVDALVNVHLVSEPYACELRTLSDVIEEQGIERIDLLKIDVENAEHAVLLGIREADWARVRQIVMEVHDVDGRLGAITSLLRTHGFEVHVEQDALLRGTPLHNLYALRPTYRRQQIEPVALPRWTSQPALVSDLRALLREQLPDYMVPGDFVLLDAIPLTAHGKLDRAALPAPAPQEQDRAYEAPVGETETVLAEIWCELLGRERVGRHDHFFELGGHSMLAVSLVERMRERGLNADVRALFVTPTLAGLAAAAEDMEILL